MCIECQDYKDEIRPWFFLHSLEGLIPGASGGWPSGPSPHPHESNLVVKLGITAAHTDPAATEPRKARKRISNIGCREWIAVLQTVGFFFFLMKEASVGVGDGQGSLACCSPRGRKESDMTERPNWTELLQSHFTFIICKTCQFNI